MTDIDAHTRLQTALAKVDTEISRSNTKSGLLLNALTLPAAVLVGTLPGRHLPVACSALVGLGTTGLVAAMLTVLTVVRPQIRHAARGTFLFWATCTPEEAEEDLALAQDTKAADLVRLSQIAKRKFSGLKVAIAVMQVSLVLLVASLPAALL
ncbi:Pycsar system effector family protein [Streptomyces lunalinharesii]|uniref:Pycsar effector protein domain-containing protein n=1 Tax=Streptomyces lunalinharesii TaxID=333384 RepID=A0ABN3SXW4_9ACTN